MKRAMTFLPCCVRPLKWCQMEGPFLLAVLDPVQIEGYFVAFQSPVLLGTAVLASSVSYFSGQSTSLA